MDTICICEGDSHQETLMVKEILESNDIACLMPNEQISNIIPSYGLVTGGFQLYVSRCRFKDAAELMIPLNFTVKNRELLGDIAEPEKVPRIYAKCSNCGENTLKSEIKEKRGLWVFFSILLGITLQPKKIQYKCEFCGHLEE
ncbi:MAG: hypothetical protein PF447_01145 [Spirochaetaceae bacterium]|nr:hypothetical protein [Spirochaetaceae bacterium]